MSDVRQDDHGAGATIVQVVEDAKAFASAQVALYRTQAEVRWSIAQGGLIFGSAALVLALSAVTALLVGLILALATLIGPLGATLAVVAVTLVVAGALGWLAAKRFSRAFGEIR